MRQHAPAVIDLLSAIVRHEPAALATLPQYSALDVLNAALDHGVLGFLSDALTGQAAPEELTAAVRAHAQQSVLEDMLREAELKHAIAALDQAGVRPLVIKGGQLAYTHYPRPDLRPRIDSDLLIAPDSRSVAHDALVGAGYQLQEGITGDLVSSQAMYVKWLNGAPTSALDVHWRIANTHVFARVLEYDELARAAVTIPGLGVGAHGLSTPHAMLLACVHRVAHHLDSERLIWLYDIHLLAQAMSAADWRTFAALAADRQVVAVCRRSLERTQARFPIAVPDTVWAHPRWRADPRDELSAGYLEARRPLRAIVDDLRALPSWRERRRLAREHLLPSTHYMRSVFAPDSRAPLAWLYLRRLARGARKWLTRSRVADVPER